MIRAISKWSVLASLMLSAAVTLHGQNKVNEVPDYKYGANPDYQLMNWKKSSHSLRSLQKTESQRPDHWNNATLKYFPPIFNQDGPSCMGSSYVGYIFTYETNALRDADGADEENQYAVFFNWLFTNFNSSKEKMLINVGNPNAVTYSGRTYSSKFGFQDWNNNEFGWMQGYDRWYSAMHNRAAKTGSFPMSVATEEGREAVKQWLWNHSGDEDFSGGGTCYVVVASDMKKGYVPSTPTNREAGAVGKTYVISWGASMDHALTLVGYDDRLEFDLDGNGVYGEKDKDEVGAWILVNSWGSGWDNGGWIYCPYKYGGVTNKGDKDPWKPDVIFERKNYRPLRTLKITMDYDNRRDISLAAGIAADTAAMKPDAIVKFDHFKNAGSKDANAAAVPMLGRWVDGMHYEPMEFGYDLTDLSSAFDRTKPLKYFFIVYTQSGSKSSGHIVNCSLMDYEGQSKGVELPFKVENLEIPGGGQTTMISVIVGGEQIYPPMNLTLTGNVLNWQAPLPSSLTLKGYSILADGSEFKQVPADVLTFNVPAGEEAHYSVKAIYGDDDNTILSSESNSVAAYQQSEEGDNQVMNLNWASFNVSNVFTQPLSKATIEFWIKPNSLTNYNQQIGPGWGTFLMHATSSGGYAFGWNTSTGNRTDGSSVMLKRNSWQHVALTVNNNTMTLYINGSRRQQLTSTEYSGLPAMESFIFGSNNNPMDCEIDELRIWSEARSAFDIYKNMRLELAQPSAYPSLLAYYKMNTLTIDGRTLIKDYARGHHATLLEDNKAEWKTEASFLRPNVEPAADFLLGSNSYYAGEAIEPTLRSLVNTKEWAWNAPAAGIENLNVLKPTFVFSEAGDYPITLKVTDVQGQTAEHTETVHIEAVEAPQVDFSITAENIPAGDHFSFINTSKATAATYVWSMPGAEVETVHGTNAGATYTQTGEHKVTLTATNAAGSKSVTKTVTVSNSAPSVDFYVHPYAVVKGDKVYLNDRSRYQPTEWFWQITNGKKNVGIRTQNSSYTPTQPGYYNVQLTATNAEGKGTASQTRCFVVANADSKNGLNFGGDGYLLKFDDPFTSSVRQFTIDWWMNPTQLEGAFSLSDNGGNYSLTTDENGNITLTCGQRSNSSTDGFVIANSWHHYALTYNNGRTAFYRDGELFNAPTMSMGLATYDFSSGITIGSATKGMHASIDELRIWQAQLSATLVKSYCNQPIDNVEEAENSHKLRLYYNFNQTGGQPQDLTSGKHHGVRSGFGPDGDAWGRSIGVFTLNFENADAETDVSARYLTNYRRPFRNTGKTVHPKYPTRFLELETGTANSAWVLKNEVRDGDVVTGAHVDTQKNYDLVVETQWTDFASQISNHILYQTPTLPTGMYRFTAVADPNNGGFNAGTSKIVATDGDTLCNIVNIEQAIAQAPLSDGSIEFVVNKEGPVSLGIIYVMSGYQSAPIREFKLERMAMEIVEGNGETSVKDAVRSGKQKAISTERGGLRVVSDQPIEVKVYDAAGQCLWNELMSGSKHIPLPKGIYIVNGEKISVSK